MVKHLGQEPSGPVPSPGNEVVLYDTNIHRKPVVRILRLSLLIS